MITRDEEFEQRATFWQERATYWAVLWARVFELALDAQAEAIYGPCALCWGMGV